MSRRHPSKPPWSLLALSLILILACGKDRSTEKRGIEELSFTVDSVLLGEQAPADEDLDPPVSRLLADLPDLVRQFLEVALGADREHLRRELAHRGERVRVDIEIERAGEANGPQHPEPVLPEPLARVARGIDHGPVTRLERRAVDFRYVTGFAGDRLEVAFMLRQPDMGVGQTVTAFAAAPDTLLGIGLGTPGLVDSGAGIVRRAVNRNWRDLPLVDLIQSRYDLPVYIANDGHVAALGEYVFGHERRAGAENGGNPATPPPARSGPMPSPKR